MKTIQYPYVRFLLLLWGIILSASALAQPANDECAGAISLTSGTSCSNIKYNLQSATPSAGLPAGCESGGTHYDVWFSFTAVSTTHTVTISSLQNNFTNPEIQLYSGACGSLTSLLCGTTTISSSTLTIGNTYFIRVSDIGASTPGTQTRFDICVTHPPAVPSNDLCSGATTLTPSSTCVNTTGSLYYATSSTPAGTCGGATATTTYDVWYQFVATSTTHAVTLSNLGNRLTATTTYMELFSGTCGSLTLNGACQNVSSRLVRTGLTIGATYYVRVYVVTYPTATPSAGWNFNICVQGPPSNNECSGAIALTSGATCTNTAGTLDLTTSNTTGVVQNCWAANNYNDVWYSFVAAAASQTITLSSMGANVTTPQIQIYSGACGALAIVGCATTSTLTQAGLTIGATYYVRIANTTNPSGAGTVANFNICVTNGVVAPVNDLCSGAISLTQSTSCSNISGTLLGSNTSGPASGCINAGSADVWYSFVAQTSFPTIAVSGNNFPGGPQPMPRIEVYSGTCGSLVSVQCSGGATLTIAGAGLTVGNTYYVRVGTNRATPLPATGSPWGFNICIYDNVTAATVDYAKSYVNITDGTVGGTIDPGDVLEIRATLVIQRTGGVTKTIDSIAYYDTLKAGQGFALIPGSIATRTNEGKLYKGFTDVFDADAGWYTTGGAGTDTAIQINLGPTGSSTYKGSLSSNSRPSLFGNTCIIMATYRVTVNQGYGTTINFGGGSFQFRDRQTGAYSTVYFPPDSLKVFQSPGACPNSISPTNILGDEYNGTFGSSPGPNGAPQNRGASPNTNYSYLPFSANTPNDYYYGVANNTSAAGSTNQLLAKPAAGRVFNLWDITGDHTGAANTARGNLPCNLAQPISATNPCGYALVINAAYRTDKAFEFTVTGACPSTNYEISAWFKNVCYKCGCDSLGTGSSGAGYIPTAPGDSSGVRPNIAVQVNGIDYYTTGDIPYQGLGGTQTGSDTLNNWVQKAFIYQTGPSETNFTMTLRNNAPGGGGNDWAIDDITLKTCSPELDLIPGPTPFICDSNLVEMSTTVRSYYNNYVYYMWEKSTDGGVNWTSTGVSGGPIIPTWNGSEWEYSVDYPPFVAYAADSGSIYRVAVATTSANLSSSSCRFSENANITLTVDPCDIVLGTEYFNFRGRSENNNAILYWTTGRETEPVEYEIQKSLNGSQFKTIGEVTGFQNPSSENNNYSFTDPEALNGLTWYRIKIIKTQQNKYKYSKVIQLINSDAGLKIESLINPFKSQVKFDLVSGFEGKVEVNVLDQYERKLKSAGLMLVKGKNNITISNTNNLPAGIYILQVVFNGHTLTKKIVKQY